MEFLQLYEALADQLTDIVVNSVSFIRGSDICGAFYKLQYVVA